MWIDKDNFASAAVVKSPEYRDCIISDSFIIIVNPVADFTTLIHVDVADDGGARHVCPDSALPARSSNQDFAFEVTAFQGHATHVNNRLTCSVAILVLSRSFSKHDQTSQVEMVTSAPDGI